MADGTVSRSSRGHRTICLPVSEDAYVRAVRDLLVRAGARRIAVLGGAGGTLATMLMKRGAEACVLVDVDPDAFAVARDYFWLAPTVECVVADAREFLERCGRRPAERAFDAIVLDAYDQDGRLPPHLADARFFRLARRCLAPDGLLIANVFAEHREEESLPDVLGAGIAAAGLPATIVDDEPPAAEDQPGGSRDRNVLVIGGPFREAWLPLPVDGPAGVWAYEERFRHCRSPRPLPPAAGAATGLTLPA